MEIKFFVRIRGAFTPPPRMEVPVMKIPLSMHQKCCPVYANMPISQPNIMMVVPCCSHHGQAYAKRNAHICPHVRRHAFEEGTDLWFSILDGDTIKMRLSCPYIELLSLAIEKHICPGLATAYQAPHKHTYKDLSRSRPMTRLRFHM